jgi:uncharacterized protein (DUF2147 family)
MRVVLSILSVNIAVLFLSLTAHAQTVSTEPSPVGLWKTIDDITGRPKSILEVSEQNGHLGGKIVKLYTKPGEDPNKLCHACSGSRHNQPIVGMMIVEGLTASADHPGAWSEGKILDPKNGKTYHCSMQLMDKGQKLKVRGYLGISLFGRTQTWIRVKSIQ